MKRTILSTTLIASAAATSGAAQTAESWEFEGRLYLWGAGIDGTTATGQGFDVSFGDLVDALDFGFMAGLEARNGHWSVLGDLQYLNLSDDANAAFGPGIPVTVDADVDGLVFTGALGYDLARTESNRVTPFAGFRYLDLGATVNLAVGGGSARVTGDRTNFDGIVGLRGGTKLSDRWWLSYYADIGTGDSDITWQVAGTFDYRLNDTWTFSAGYRHLAWEFDDPVVLRDVAFSGPIFGARMKF